jgi:mRNA interferase MazF
VARGYVPGRGDLVWLGFTPQAGVRPAIVLSPREYNQKVGLALLCPITSHVKGYPFEVLLPDTGKLRGAILADQVKSLDWRARRAKYAGAAPARVLEDVTARVLALLDPR